MNEPASMTWEEAVIAVRDDPVQRQFARDCYYDDPLIAAAERFWQSSEWRAIRALLPPTKGAALDIGSGRGISAFALARDGWTVSALEPNPSAIVGAAAIRSLATEAKLPIIVYEQWGETLPFGSDQFDLVHCRAVLHHAHDLKALGREVARVLKPGGLFIGAREHVVSSHDEIPAFQNAHPLHRLYGGEYAYTVKEYATALRDAGLQIRQTLNPYQSNANLSPGTLKSIRVNWASRLGVSFLWPLIPAWLVGLRGKFDRTPGRLYTFIAFKPQKN